MTIDSCENDFIEDFKENVKNGNLNPTNVDLLSSKAQRKYNNYIDKIIRINPCAYKTTSFESIGKEEIFNLAGYIILFIFGDDILPELEQFLIKLKYSGSTEVLDGVALTATNRITKEEDHFAVVPDLVTSSNIVTIVHEFVHYHLKQINADFNKKRYYEEILSIFTEKIALYVLANLRHEDNFAQKIEETRLDCIKWHYTTKVEEFKLLLQTYEQCKSIQHSASRNFITEQIIVKMESELPYLKTPEDLKIYKQYSTNMSDSYGIGYLYSESLLVNFFDASILVMNKIREIFKKEITLQEALDYFDINAKNPQVYENADKRLELISKIKL